MFQIEDLLLPAVTALMPGDASAVMPKFNHACVSLRMHLSPRMVKIFARCDGAAWNGA
jgi:hypothetical protein